MRCPDCAKFVGFEQADPEVELELDDGRDTEAEDKEKPQSVTITAQVRLVLTCTDCGTELKEANPEGSEEVEIEGHLGDGHELSVEDDGADTTDRFDGKPGTPARYRRHFYGASISFHVMCTCTKDSLADGSIEIEEAAGCFDELV